MSLQCPLPPNFSIFQEKSPRPITLWDHYAAAALSGMLAGDVRINGMFDDAARFCADCADAMLAERAKRGIK